MAASEHGHDGTDAFEQGDALLGRDDLSGAEEAYRRGDEAGHPAAAAKLGYLLEHRGDRPGAEEAYRRADERGDGFGTFRLGLLLAGGDRWQEADRLWRRAEERGTDPVGVDIVELLRRREHAEAQDAAPTPDSRSPFANPVLVGAITVLVLLVAVFLSYNANQGLPFVPSRQLKVLFSDGSNLVVGNDVREGGFRIGLVSQLKPVEMANGTVGAQATLQLDQAHGSIPTDSSATILPRSVLGLKYVQIQVGSARSVYPDGATMPLSRTNVPVQFDDIYKTFNKPTRDAITKDLNGFGNALAARGSALNDTIASLPQLLLHLNHVAAYLSQPQAGLIRFFDSLNSFMGAVAPVAQTNAQLFTDLGTTFEAFSRDPNALEQTIAKSPSTEQVSIDSLKVQQPFLSDLATFGRYMTPATQALRGALPVINPAIESGTRVLGRTPVLNAKLQEVMNALKALALAPGTNIAINGLGHTVSTLNPIVKYVGPYQTVCDYWNYWWTFLSEHVSQHTGYGFSQRALLNFADGTQQNNVGSLPATAPAGTNGGPEYLHAPNYGAAIDTAGNADCESGQRGYPKKLNAADPLGRTIVTDPHVPGDQGPTFAGRAHVPAGETFSRTPITGAQLAANPTNP